MCSPQGILLNAETKIIHFALTLEEFVWTYDNNKFGGKYEILKLLVVFFLLILFFRSNSYLLSLLSFFFGLFTKVSLTKKKERNLSYGDKIHIHTYIHIQIHTYIYVHLWRVLFSTPYPIPTLPKQTKTQYESENPPIICFYFVYSWGTDDFLSCSIHCVRCCSTFLFNSGYF